MKICIKRSEEITDINVFSELATSRSQQDTVDIFCSSWARKGILKPNSQESLTFFKTPIPRSHFSGRVLNFVYNMPNIEFLRIL